MPCFCWMSDDSLDPEMRQIRSHMKEVVRLINVLHAKGDFMQKGSPLPRDLLEDCHKLLNDIYSGECAEKG